MNIINSDSFIELPKYKADVVMADIPYSGSWGEQKYEYLFELLTQSANKCIVLHVHSNIWAMNKFMGYLGKKMVPKNYTIWFGRNMASHIVVYRYSDVMEHDIDVIYLKQDENTNPEDIPLSICSYICSQVEDAKTMLDPFMGRGNMGLAARNAGIDYTGIEINKDIFNEAFKRINCG